MPLARLPRRNRLQRGAPALAEPVPGLARLVRTHCDACGAPVRWIDATEAAARGMVLADITEPLGISVDRLDVWSCTMCPGGGIFPRN